VSTVAPKGSLGAGFVVAVRALAMGAWLWKPEWSADVVDAFNAGLLLGLDAALSAAATA